MKKIILLIVASAFLFSCSTSGKQIETNSIKETEDLNSENELNENLYSNDLLNISFSYPKSWEIQTDTINKILYILSPSDSNDLFQEMMNIVVGEMNGMSLNSFFSMNLKAVEGMFDELNQTEEPGEVNINYRVFKKVKYNYVFQGYPLTANLFVTHNLETSYVVNCSSLQNTFDQYQNQFLSVVNSIEIK